MKATIEQAKLAYEKFATFNGQNVPSMQAALQAVFDTFPTEPTPEMIERAEKAWVSDKNGTTKSALLAALKAAMTEPPPKVYPYAEKYDTPNYVVVHFSEFANIVFFVPPQMEFDYEKITMRLKK